MTHSDKISNKIGTTERFSPAGKTIFFFLTILIIAGLTQSRAQGTWVQKNDVGLSVSNGPTERNGATGFSIGSKGYIGTGYKFSFQKDFWEYDPTANTWTQKADFGGTGRASAAGFSIGSKGYVGTGNNGTALKDFWEYDPATNTWTQKADFGGVSRYGATGFSISSNSKGYIGTGSYYSAGDQYLKDWWEYNPSTNTWTQKSDFGGIARSLAAGFSIGSKGYVGTGYNISNGAWYKDFWEYDPSTNNRTQKADCGTTGRSGAVGFSISSKGYIGTGYNNGAWYKDFREYDPVANSWTQKADLIGSPRYLAAGFAIGTKGYIGTGYVNLIGDQDLRDFWELNPTSNTWTQKADFGGAQRERGIGLSIGSKGYIGTGLNDVFLTDFWEYDPGNGTWAQKADFGGSGRWQPAGFSIGSKGYIGTGFPSSKDFWEYDPVSNTWSQKADFGGSIRSGTVGFSIGNKGYIGTGGNGGSQYRDLWEYDPTTNIWTSKAYFLGTKRVNASGFSIGTKAYIGLGSNSSLNIRFKDFWEYDPSSNVWTQKADFGGTAREFAVGFSIQDKGYFGTGYNNGTLYKDFWEYDPATNSWIQKADFGGTSRYAAVGFSIDNHGYIGTGDDNSGYRQDFWEYTPDANVVCEPCPLPLSVYISDISATKATVHWTGNSCAYSYRVRKRPVGSFNWIKSSVNAPDTLKKIVNNIPDTTYEVQVQTYCDSLKTDSSGYTASVYFNSSGCIYSNIFGISASVNPICKGNSTLLTVTGDLNNATGWSWYTNSCGGTTAGTGISITVSPSSATTYYVRGEGGCIVAGACNSITVNVNSKPKATITALGNLDICTTGSVDLQANSGTNFSYQWKLNGSNISSATNQIYHATQTGDYKVTVTNNQGCSKISQLTTVYTSCKSGVPSSNDPTSSLRFYPNPFESFAVISFLLPEDSRVQIDLYDLTGRKLQTVLDKNMDAGNQDVNLSCDQLDAGIYFLQLTMNNEVVTKKIVIE